MVCPSSLADQPSVSLRGQEHGDRRRFAERDDLRHRPRASGGSATQLVAQQPSGVSQGLWVVERRLILAPFSKKSTHVW